MEQQLIYDTAQEYLTQEGITGWLVYDYRQANPVFWLVISDQGMSPDPVISTSPHRVDQHC